MLGLAALGALGLAALGRRRRFELFADWDDGRFPAPRARPAGDLAATEAPEGAAPAWLAGPAGNLRVRDNGTHTDALPVLFVHSLGGNGGQWELQLDHLRAGRRAVALDLRGHGDSDPADDADYGVPALARDLAAVADQMALRRFILVGHSLGASVAIHYAAAHAPRVAGLLLADPSGDQSRLPESQLAPFLAALAAAPLAELESTFRQLVVGGDRAVSSWVLEDLRLTDEQAIAGAASALVRYSPLADLARYSGPKLAVISDLNSLPYSLHNLAPELSVRLVPGTGHWLMMDRPAVFNRILDDFLEEAEREAAPAAPTARR